MFRPSAVRVLLVFCASFSFLAVPAPAAILWSDLGVSLAHETGVGSDILGGALQRDDSAGDRLYFKFHVDPHSDVSTEEYFAGFQLYQGADERLAVGNSQKAWAYSAFNTAEMGPSNNVPGDFDLRSSRPESTAPGVFFSYELPRRGIDKTIVFKVEYRPGTNDQVTVWLNPDLAPGATEESQPESKTTRFTANASFNEIHLRHGGGGEGWAFSDMAIATSFNDFVSAGSETTGGATEGSGRGSLPLTFRLWQREQGLPQNSVRALEQTRDGYLWVGSDDGIARFDGVRFVTFGPREGFAGGRVRLLLEDSHQRLWIGTIGGGLACRDEGKFTTFTHKDGLPSDSITSLAEDASGRLWVGTEAGLAIWENGRPVPLEPAAQFAGKPVTTIYRDRRGVMWLGATGAGLFRFLNGRFERLTDSSVEALVQDPHCLLEDLAGRIWLGAGDDFVLCRDHDQWRRYRLPHHLARPYVTALAEQPDGTVWAGSISEGLFEFQGGKLAAINANSGLSDNFIESLLVDREGNLWVGTGAGLNRLRRGNLSTFGQNEGLGYGPVQGLAEVAPGAIWAGKLGDGAYRLDHGRFTPLGAAEPLGRYRDLNALLVASDGSCWMGGARGLWHFRDPRSAAGEEEVAAMTGRNVISLAEERGLWAGTQEGELWREVDGAWRVQTNFTQSHPITAIVSDKAGGVWVGTDGGGLLRLQGEGYLRISKHGGLLSDFIRTLYLDQQGTLWIGTAGAGLSRWRDGHLKTFTTREGLPDNTISQILEDGIGRLWLGSNRGIACVRKDELEQLAWGKAPALYPQVYGKAEGMLSEECTGGFFPAGLKTKSRLLWFSTLKGIVVADPRPKAADVPAPAVLLEEMLVDGEQVGGQRSEVRGRRSEVGDQDSGLSVRIPPGQHRLEFHYTGLSFSAPDRVRFRYRLEPLDPDWVEAGTRRTAFYGYVPPGPYAFHVSACTSDGRWNEHAATIGLTVLPHFWQSRWFLGIGALGLLAAVGGAVRIFEKRRHQLQFKRLEQEHALERERARIAQDLHDDLGSSLTRISLLSDLLKSDKDNPSQVATHADKISQSAGQTVRALEEIVWALRPGSDSLQSLVEYIAHFANEMFEDDPTRCRLDLPHDLPTRVLPPEMRHNIFLIVKEALTNALKHAGAKEVRVQAKASSNWLEITIEDDGRGFDVAQDTELRTQDSAPRRRHGLGNMRERAAAMRGTLKVQSIPHQGTSVTLRVNFPPHIHAVEKHPQVVAINSA